MTYRSAVVSVTALCLGALLFSCSRDFVDPQPVALRSAINETAQKFSQNIIRVQHSTGLSSLESNALGSKKYIEHILKTKVVPGMSAKINAANIDLPAGPCVTYSGDLSDKDADGILANMQETYDCNYSYSSGIIHVSGIVTSADGDDFNHISGFGKEYSNLKFTVTSGPDINKEWRYNSRFDLSYNSSGHSMPYYGSFEDSMRLNNNINDAVQLSYNFVPENSSNPFMGGFTEVNGTQYAIDMGSTDNSYQISSSQLKLTDACGRDSYIDSGKITVSNRIAVNTLSYNDCSAAFY